MGSRPVLFRMWSSISGCHPLDASSTPPTLHCDIKNVLRHCQIPWGANITPCPTENRPWNNGSPRGLHTGIPVGALASTDVGSTPGGVISVV